MSCPRRLAQRGVVGEAYYPRNLIQPKTQFFVEAILEEIQHENPA